MTIKLVCCGQLYDLTEVHHRDAVTHVLDHAEIVRDENVGQIMALLEVLEEVENL